MRRLFRSFAVLLCLFVAAPAFAVVPKRFGTILDTVALTAAAGSRTFTIPLGGAFRAVVYTVVFTRGGASTGYTLTCTGSQDSGTTYGSVPSTSVAADGTGTVAPFVDKRTISATDTMMYGYDVTGLDLLKCVAADISGATSSDTIKVIATGVE